MATQPFFLNGTFWLRQFLILFLYSLPTGCLFGQSLSLSFTNLSVEGGLPNPAVLDVLQDDKGFMWLATPTKVVRYDGYEIVEYPLTKEIPDSLSLRDRPSLYLDQEGGIWAALWFAPAKLYKYHPEQDDFIPYLYDPERNIHPIKGAVFALGEDPSGNLLVTVERQGLFSIDVKKAKEGVAPADLPYRVYPARPERADALPVHFFGNTIVNDDRGHCWIPTDAGLCEFDPGTGRFQTYHYSPDTTAGANSCFTLFRDHSGRLWVGTYDGGFWEFDLEKQKFRRSHFPEFEAYIPGRTIPAITEDRVGHLWLILGRHLYRFDPNTGTFQVIRNQRRRGTGTRTLINPTSLSRDHTGSIWVGSWHSGLFIHNPDREAFQFFMTDVGETSDPVAPLISRAEEDASGRRWLASRKNGLFCWDPRGGAIQNWRSEPGRKNSLSDNSVKWLVRGKKDYLWVATSVGLDRLHLPTGQVTQFLGKQYQFERLYRLQDGSVLATYHGKGIFRMEDEEAARFIPCRSNLEDINWRLKDLHTLKEDSAGRLWLGTNQLGLLRVDPDCNRFELLLRFYGVKGIAFDQEGKVWITTHSSGLKLFDPETNELTPLAPEEQAKIGMAHSIQMDDRGRLWLMTANGITEFDPLTRKVVRQFSYRYWQSADNPWFWNTPPGKFSSGELYFTSPNGLFYFHPDSVRTNSFPPKVALTSFSLFGRRLEPGSDPLLPRPLAYLDEITLLHDQNDITIGYAGMHFKAPAANTYRYRLVNFDDRWNEVGAQRTATYTNLSPGRYRFEVQASNSDGVRNEQGAALWIVVRPPWYQTTWARLLFVAASLVLLFLTYRFLLRRQAERAEAFRLQELNHFKSRFYANITHEFRTPLTLILGVSDQLRQKFGQKGEAELGLIARSGRQVLHLVNQLLDLSKLEDHRLDLHYVQADIIPFLRGLAAAFDSAARRKGVEYVVHITEPALVMDFDPAKTQAVVENLVSNALKFTPAGGKVEVEVEVEVEGAWLVFVVRDSGVGIPAAALPHIFDRFYQVDNSATREGEGAGIGLALVKELVELLGGTMEVESTVGQGARFGVRLPIRQTAKLQPVAAGEPFTENLIAAEEEAAAHPLFPAPDSIEQPFVLIVEDHPDMAAFIAEQLRGGYRVQQAADGEAGIRQAQALSPDLIISDVMMPKKDGFELCRTLKQDERTSHTPIILLTAKAEQSDRLSGLEHGADAYLTKPFDRRELLIRVEQLLALRETLRRRYGRLGDTSWEEAPADPEAVFLRKVRRLILDNLSDPDFDMHTLYRALNMGRTNLYQKLKALTGRSPALYIRAVRLYEARRMLEETSLSVSEISYATGFSNPNYFSTCFKEAFQAPPTAWRKPTA